MRQGSGASHGDGSSNSGFADAAGGKIDGLERTIDALRAYGVDRGFELCIPRGSSWLPRLEPLDQPLVLDDPQRLDHIDTGEPLPLEMLGHAPLDVGTTVAYALNGTVGAVTTVEPWPSDDGELVHGLVPPDLFQDTHHHNQKGGAWLRG